MDERQEKILSVIVAEHVKTAQPVGSQALASEFGVSSATIRNDMAALEDAGYIAQPHPSAGRVPTEQGYRYYVDRFLEPRDPSERQQRGLREAFDRSSEHQQRLRELAKSLSELSGQSVIVGFGPFDVYYTGISQIFSQPEFAGQQAVYDISRVVDHLDEVVARVFRAIPSEPQVLIGSQNPFGTVCSSILVSFQASGGRGIVGLLGPMRMDYSGNVGLMSFTHQLITH